MADPDFPPLMTVADAAAAMHVSRYTLYRWIEAGLFPAVRLPAGTIRVRRDDVTATLSQPA